VRWGVAGRPVRTGRAAPGTFSTPRDAVGTALCAEAFRARRALIPVSGSTRWNGPGAAWPLGFTRIGRPLVMPCAVGRAERRAELHHPDDHACGCLREYFMTRVHCCCRDRWAAGSIPRTPAQVRALERGPRPAPRHRTCTVGAKVSERPPTRTRRSWPSLRRLIVALRRRLVAI
jgi:hypothetical protein